MSVNAGEPQPRVHLAVGKVPVNDQSLREAKEEDGENAQRPPPSIEPALPAGERRCDEGERRNGWEATTECAVGDSQYPEQWAQPSL